MVKINWIGPMILIEGALLYYCPYIIFLSKLSSPLFPYNKLGGKTIVFSHRPVPVHYYMSDLIGKMPQMKGLNLLPL